MGETPLLNAQDLTQISPEHNLIPFDTDRTLITLIEVANLLAPRAKFRRNPTRTPHQLQDTDRILATLNDVPNILAPHVTVNPSD